MFPAVETSLDYMSCKPMSEPTPTHDAIIYAHYGPLPRHLLNTIENSRVFNPDLPIFVLGDQPNDALKRVSATFIPFESVQSPEHRDFIESYRHISTESVQFERFCISRWFYVWQLMKQKKLKRVIHLDSDGYLFAPASEMFDLLSNYPIVTAVQGCPYCAIIQESLDGLIQSILKLCHDTTTLDLMEAAWQKNVESGQLPQNLNDMLLLERYMDSRGDCAYYHQLPPTEGFFDLGIAIPEGCVIKGRRKRFYWRIENSRLVPYIRHAKDGRFQRVYCLHFDGGQKRKMARYNRVSGSPFKIVELLSKQLLHNNTFLGFKRRLAPA